MCNPRGGSMSPEKMNFFSTAYSIFNKIERLTQFSSIFFNFLQFSSIFFNFLQFFPHNIAFFVLFFSFFRICPHFFPYNTAFFVVFSHFFSFLLIFSSHFPPFLPSTIFLLLFHYYFSSIQILFSSSFTILFKKHDQKSRYSPQKMPIILPKNRPKGED